MHNMIVCHHIRMTASHATIVCFFFVFSTHYSGGYNFKIDIGKQTKDTKATAWTVSMIIIFGFLAF